MFGKYTVWSDYAFYFCVLCLGTPLRKHAYSNILKILPPENEFFSIKILIFFSNFCSKHRLWYSLEPPLTRTHNLCFWSEIRKLMYTPVNPVLLYKSGVEGGQHNIGMFSWCTEHLSILSGLICVRWTADIKETQGGRLSRITARKINRTDLIG